MFVNVCGRVRVCLSILFGDWLGVACLRVCYVIRVFACLFVCLVSLRVYLVSQ